MKTFLIHLGIALCIGIFGFIPLMGLPGAMILGLCKLPLKLFASPELYQQIDKGGDAIWPAAILITWTWPICIVVLGIFFGWIFPDATVKAQIVTYVLVGYVWGGACLPVTNFVMSHWPENIQDVNQRLINEKISDEEMISHLSNLRKFSAKSWNQSFEWSNNQSLRPLEFAAIRGNIQVIERLITEGADIKLGFPLHAAAFAGQLQAFEFFLKHGRKIDELDSYDRSALHYALGAKDYYAYVYRLRNVGETKNVLPYDYRWVRGKDRDQIIQKLFPDRKKIGALKTSESLILAATIGDRTRELKVLLDEKYDPFVVDRNGRSPLHIAAHLQIWNSAFILANVPELNKLQDRDGKTAGDLIHAAILADPNHENHKHATHLKNILDN